MNDKEAMLHALKLSMRGTGRVSPNPRVGAVIIKNGEIIGEGWHREIGMPHAEVEAINSAGLDSFDGATIYVNLEPCAHYGNTPPCSELLVQKNFSRVVIGMQDPNPLVNGKGIAILREAGINVDVGICEEESRWVNRFFEKHISSGMPYVVVKIAQSLDGCIASARGESKWISCLESRKRSHALRAEIDAVLIGKLTATVDNPQLTVREVPGRNPKRVIFDTNLSLPLGLNAFKDTDRNNIIVCCKPEAIYLRKASTLKVAGINVLPVNLNDDGKIDINSALLELSEKYGITSIMIEGGATIFSSFLQAEAVDEFQIFIAPKLIGRGINAFADFNINFITEAPIVNILSVSKSGEDIHIIGKRKINS